MKDKYDTDEYVIGEDKLPRNGSLRQESELFDEKSHVPHGVIGVKRVEYGKGEDWEVLQDDKVALVLKGVRFTSKEKEFLRSVDGIKFIMTGFKSGWKSVSEFKRRIKEYL